MWTHPRSHRESVCQTWAGTQSPAPSFLILSDYFQSTPIHSTLHSICASLYSEWGTIIREMLALSHRLMRSKASLSLCLSLPHTYSGKHCPLSLHTHSGKASLLLHETVTHWSQRLFCHDFGRGRSSGFIFIVWLYPVLPCVIKMREGEPKEQQPVFSLDYNAHLWRLTNSHLLLFLRLVLSCGTPNSTPGTGLCG